MAKVGLREWLALAPVFASGKLARYSDETGGPLLPPAPAADYAASPAYPPGCDPTVFGCPVFGYPVGVVVLKAPRFHRFDRVDRFDRFDRFDRLHPVNRVAHAARPSAPPANFRRR